MILPEVKLRSLFMSSANVDRVGSQVHQNSHILEDTPRFPLQIGRRTEWVSAEQIELVLAQRNYISIFVGSREFVMRSTLQDFITQLPERRFVRVHRSLVVQLGSVQAMDAMASGRYRLTLRSGRTLETGRRFRRAVRERFGAGERTSA
jgi:two-component system, LytTR family, response regulator